MGGFLRVIYRVVLMEEEYKEGECGGGCVFFFSFFVRHIGQLVKQRLQL